MKGAISEGRQFLQNVLKKNHLFAVLVLLLPLFVFLTSCSDDDPVSSNINSELNSQIEKFTFLTENYPPFNYDDESGVAFGVSVEILEEIFNKMGVNLDRNNVELKDWSEAYQATIQTNNTILFSTVRLSERESLFKWVGPIVPHKETVISLKSKNITINSGSDLSNYKIAVIKDYSTIPLLVDYGVNTADLIVVEDVAQLYDMLNNGTVDCIGYSEISHQLIMQALQLNESDYEIPFILKVSQLYYAFNTNTSDEIINYFQTTLDELINDKGQDGTSNYDKIVSKYNIINYSDDGITDEMVINLVDKTSDDIAADAVGTIEKMNNGEAPYLDPNIPALYSFTYDTSMTVVAHPTNSLLVGVNLKGKPDVSGKLFRDEVQELALTQGTGWVDYIYTKPGEGGLYYKTSYYKLTTGSNGELYIVGAGKYK